MKTMIKRTVMGTAIALAAMGANAADLYISPATATVAPGGTFTATVVGDFRNEFNAGFTDGGFLMEWDTTQISLVSHNFAAETQTQLTAQKAAADALGTSLPFVPGSFFPAQTIVNAGQDSLDVAMFNCYLDSVAGATACGTITDTGGDNLIDIYEMVFEVAASADISLALTALGVSSVGAAWLSAGADGSNIPGTIDVTYAGTSVTVNEVPLPAAVWLFGTGLLGLAGISRRRNQPEAAAA